MANERSDERLGEAIGVLFTASRDGVAWGLRSLGEIQIDAIGASGKVASSVVKTAGELAVEAIDGSEHAAKRALQASRTLAREAAAVVGLVVRDLPVGTIEVLRHVLAAASDAVKGGIREAADIAATAAAAVGRVAHETTDATQRMAGDVTGVARAGIGGAIDVGRTAGTTGVRAAREVLGGLVEGARGIGNVRPFRLRAAPSPRRPASGRGRRRAASARAAS